MKPITQLTKVVDDMAEGNWESKAPEAGKDEVATLGRHFNRMADKIQDNIQQIRQEADAKQEFVDNFALLECHFISKEDALTILDTIFGNVSLVTSIANDFTKISIETPTTELMDENGFIIS
jgi:methyl-accepting chemotaxis protein